MQLSIVSLSPPLTRQFITGTCSEIYRKLCPSRPSTYCTLDVTKYKIESPGKVLTISNQHQKTWENHTSMLVSFTVEVDLYTAGADPRMVRIGTGPPFWQINHANSAYFRLFWGYFQVISATRPPLLDLGLPFLHILDPPLLHSIIPVDLPGGVQIIIRYDELHFLQWGNITIVF